MAMNDWNHNGKNDAFDYYVDYKLSGGSNGSSGRSAGGGISTFGAILCVIAGLVEQSIIYTALGIEVDDVPTIVIVILWIMFSSITAAVVSSIKKE